MIGYIILAPFFIIYALICYGCVRLFGKNNGIKGSRFEATFIVVSFTPLFGIFLANYILSSD